MVEPNFFIAGVPKGGTTALHTYLGGHPNVFVTEPKEPMFWASDFPTLHKVHSLEEYLDLFAEAGEQHLAVGEASACYLYSDSALPAIREFCPDAKIIAMLRNPIDQAYSFHSQMALTGNEDVDDFEKAWRLQEARAEGRSIPRWCRNPSLLQYKAVASYGDQVDKLLRLFPREQVRVILFEDFSRRTGDVYAQTLGFLGVDDDGRRQFAPVHVGRTHLWPALGRFLHHTPRFMQWTCRALKPMLGLQRTNLSKVVAVRKKRRPLAPEFRAELTDVFRDDVAKLAELIQRDLSAWQG